MTTKSTLSLAFPFILLASLAIDACNVSGQPCGLLNVSACAPPPPSCGDVLIGMGGGTDTGLGGGTDTGMGGAMSGMGGDPNTSTSTVTTTSTTVGSGAGGGDPGDPSPMGLTCMDGDTLDTYVRCTGLTPIACAAQCKGIGAYCVEYADHPYKPNVGAGPLKQCKNGSPTWTCTYCYTTGDTCTFIYPGGLALCNYTGGKGCE